MTISENIRARREALALTQEQLAEKVGVSRQTVGKWEEGASVPDLANAGALAKALDVSLDELVSFDQKATGTRMPPRGKHIFGTVALGERGQIVIPKAARELFGYAPGERLLILGDEAQGGLAVMKSDIFWNSIEQLKNAASSETKSNL